MSKIYTDKLTKRRVCRCLIIETKFKGNPRAWTPPGIVYDAKPVDGIALLTREFGGNVYENGIVNITASSCQRAYHPKNVADFKTNSALNSDDVTNSWICYDFNKCDPNELLSESVWQRSLKLPSHGLGHWQSQMTGPLGRKWLSLEQHNRDQTLQGLASCKRKFPVSSPEIDWKESFWAWEVFGTLRENN